MRILILMLLLVLFGCGRYHTERDTHTDTEVLREMYERYRELSRSTQDRHGFIYTHECDSLLFSALLASATRSPIEMESAELEPGRFVRRPLDYPSCYDEVEGTGSDISRDMITGVIVYSYFHDRLDLLERIWAYGEQHGWKMGRGDDRTVMSPALIGHLARVIYYLSSGKVDHPERHLPQIWIPVPGYQSHLMMLQILVEGEISGGISDVQLEALRKIAKSSPRNPLPHALLHRYTDGDQTLATHLLLSIWPRDRLPTSSDWCEHWRTQNADLAERFQPCPEEARTHSGGDFLFAAALVLGVF